MAYDRRISDWSSDVCSSDLIDAVGVGNRLGDFLGLASGADQVHCVAQPLHGGAGNENAALERIGGLAVDAVGDRRQQPVLRALEFAAGVEHQKAAGAVGRLAHARRSEEHTSEFQSLMRISYAVFCLKKKNNR